MKIIQKTLKLNITHTILKMGNIEKNVCIPFDIYVKKGENYFILIEAGRLIDDKIYDYLAKNEPLYILKNDEEKQELSCMNIKEYIGVNKDMYKKTLEFLYKMNAQQSLALINDKSNVLQKQCIENIVDSIIFLVLNQPDYLKNSIEYFSNEYSLDIHSLHVAIYAVHLGHALNMSRKEIFQLGIAGLLHDIGIKKIKDDILHKNVALNLHELEEVQKHPRYSLEIVEHNYIHDPYVLDAIMHHHERYDGSGYPNQLYANQIKPHASILAICDVFDAMTNNRPYREKFTYFEALKFMMKDPSMKNKFNDEYLRVFLKSLGRV